METNDFPNMGIQSNTAQTCNHLNSNQPSIEEITINKNEMKNKIFMNQRWYTFS